MFETVSPLITVITPVYNSPYLFDTIDSVLEQTYSNIQYIIIDDGSDNFPETEIRQQLKQHTVTNLREIILQRNAHNLGTVKTLNVALSLAKGAYIFNLAGDDCFFDKYVIEDWVREFQRTEALAITAYRDVYDTQLQHFIQTLPSESDVNRLNRYSPQELFEYFALHENFISGSCTAFSRSCFEKYGSYDEHYKYLEDYPKYLFLLRRNVPIHFFARKVIRYRLGGLSTAGPSVSKVLERDLDELYQTSILPYTRNHRKCKRIYNYRRLQIKYRDRKIKLFLLYLWFYWKQPWIPIMKVLLGKVSLKDKF